MHERWVSCQAKGYKNCGRRPSAVGCDVASTMRPGDFDIVTTTHHQKMSEQVQGNSLESKEYIPISTDMR